MTVGFDDDDDDDDDDKGTVEADNCCANDAGEVEVAACGKSNDEEFVEAEPVALATL